MRLFIAIDIDEKKIIEEVNIIQSKLSDRKKLSNNLHITLLFIEGPTLEIHDCAHIL